jgi:imidazole glycerol-phosphate synthase subunit HisF
VLRKRVIPSLLVQRGGLVKTTRFKRPVYVGDPINAVKIFNEKEVDELFLFDIDASKEGRGPDFDMVKGIVSEAFMPVAYGGGVRTVDDARKLLKLGVEKVALNSAARRDTRLVSDLASRFGAQCVVGVVDVRKRWGRHVVYSHDGSQVPERSPSSWAQQLVRAGCGEVLVQSVDQDGLMQGFDLALLRGIRGQVSVPVVAAGGANTVDSMTAALQAGGLSGVAVGARFVFIGPHRAVLISYLTEDERALLSA